MSGASVRGCACAWRNDRGSTVEPKLKRRRCAHADSPEKGDGMAAVPSEP